MNRTEEILNQLDKYNAEYTFPMLDNGYVYPAGTKLTAYRDDECWAIVIEVIGFSYRGGGNNGISNCLHIFGNCLGYEPGIQNENFIHMLDDAKDSSTFDDEKYFYLNSECVSFTLRGVNYPIPHKLETYKSARINIEDDTRINAFEFLRLLDILYHDKLVATEKEIRERIPIAIPKIIELHEWFHPDVINGALPSENETFKLIAKVLESGNPEHYKPTHKPNTHWTNWPDGGTL